MSKQNAEFAFAGDPTSTYGFGPADPAAPNAWRVAVNGKELSDVRTVEVWNQGMDVNNTYALTEEGYPKTVIREPGGGGSVTVPYLYVSREDLAVAPSLENLHIGAVMQKRGTMYPGLVLNLPRGFVSPGESHRQTAGREFAEETGRHIAFIDRFVEIGVGGNPNSAFFDTTGIAADGKPNGVRHYALRVNPEEVEAIETPQGPIIQFKQDVRDGVLESARQRAADIAPGDEKVLKDTLKTAEGILGSRFVHWEIAATSPDLFTSAGVAKLLGQVVMPQLAAVGKVY